MRNRLIAMAAAAILSVTMVACSSDDGDAADGGGAEVEQSVGDGGTADDAADAADDAADSNTDSNNDSDPDPGPDPGPDAETDAETDTGTDEDPAGDANSVTDEDAEYAESADDGIDPSGGATCELLMTFYNDVISLPERIDAGDFTEEEAAAMIDPVRAAKDDLPGMVGIVLPIFQHDFDFASVMSSGEEMQDYMDRGSHGTAMAELITSTQMACDLPASWPGDE